MTDSHMLLLLGVGFALLILILVQTPKHGGLIETLLLTTLGLIAGIGAAFEGEPFGLVRWLLWNLMGAKPRKTGFGARFSPLWGIAPTIAALLLLPGVALDLLLLPLVAAVRVIARLRGRGPIRPSAGRTEKAR